MTTSPQPVELNTADREQLLTLPGIGPVLADRILKARPFAKLEDLTVVQGLGSQLVEDLREQITWTDLDQPAQPDRESEAASKRPAPKESPNPELLPERSERSKTRFLTKKQALGWGITAAVLTLAITAALILGFLRGLNRGLRYPSPADVQQLDRQLSTLSRQVDQLDLELGELQERMDNLEQVSDRIEALDDRVDRLDGELDQADQRLQSVEAEAQIFRSFLETLTEYLNQLFPGKE